MRETDGRRGLPGKDLAGATMGGNRFRHGSPPWWSLRRTGWKIWVIVIVLAVLGSVVPAPAVSAGVAPEAVTESGSGSSGYWLLRADGRVHQFGSATFFGDLSGQGFSVNSATKLVKILAAPDGDGYWVLDESGRVRGFGSAEDLGSPALPSGVKATTMAATPDGGGYWVFTNLGTVHPRGNAQFYGDMGGISLDGPVVDSAATPTGRGYYLLGSDGGIFSFGDAEFHGSVPGVVKGPLNQPVVGIVPTPGNDGYWLVAADGGVFAFDAPFVGSVPGVVSGPLDRPVNGMISHGDGYLMVASDGGVFNFSDKPFAGSLGGQGVTDVIGVAAIPGPAESSDSQGGPLPRSVVDAPRSVVYGNLDFKITKGILTRESTDTYSSGKAPEPGDTTHLFLHVTAVNELLSIDLRYPAAMMTLRLANGETLKPVDGRLEGSFYSPGSRSGGRGWLVRKGSSSSRILSYEIADGTDLNGAALVVGEPGLRAAELPLVGSVPVDPLPVAADFAPRVVMASANLAAGPSTDVRYEILSVEVDIDHGHDLTGIAGSIKDRTDQPGGIGRRSAPSDVFVRVKVRVSGTSHPGANFFDTMFRMMVDGVPRSSTTHLNKTLLPGQTGEFELVFRIPRDPGNVALRVGHPAGSTADIQMTLPPNTP